MPTKKIVGTYSGKSFTFANGYAVNIGASNEIQKSTKAWLMIRCNDGPLLMDPLRRSSNSKFANISHFCDDHLLCSHCAFTFHRRNIRRELSLFTVCELDWYIEGERSSHNWSIPGRTKEIRGRVSSSMSTCKSNGSSCWTRDIVYQRWFSNESHENGSD